MTSDAELELGLPILVELIEEYYLGGSLDELELRNQLTVMSLENLRSFVAYAKTPELLSLASAVLESREAKLTNLPTPTVRF